MFFPINNLDTYWDNFLTLYGSSILGLSSKWYNMESIYGNSCIQYKVNQYYLAFYLGVLIKSELDKGVNTSYSYYDTKYGITDKAKILTCHGIKLDKVLDILDIVFVETTDTSSGIESMQLETSFIVEPDYTITTTQTTLLNIINSNNQCNSIFEIC